MHVALLWCRRSNEVYVSVNDEASGDSFLRPVRRDENAMEVFRDPYAECDMQAE
jgi:hypothetical protein